MKNFIYTNNKTKTILFESIEEDETLLTAVDVKFEAETGINPVKAMYVGCQIIPL